MKILNLNDWNDFESQLELIHADINKYKKSEHTYISRPLFRGQSCSSWALQSTLERYLGRPAAVDDYQRYLYVSKPAVEAFTEREFKFAYGNEISKSFRFMGDVSFLEGQYEFMVYLRHHGFPSPLLDWSRSPYVALYFAYEAADLSADVAVFTYVEHLGMGKGGAVGSPEIGAFGHYVYSHKRHFIQQSEYTACVKKEGDRWYYCPHEEAFEKEFSGQDLLIKMVLPGSEKTKILTKLDAMNINAFSLFGSEEGLMKMLAFREKRVFST